jgi:hypothetical protein
MKACFKWAAAGALRPAAVSAGSAELPDGGRLRRVESSSELERLRMEPPEFDDQLTALRDVAFLRWHYFEGDDATRALYAFPGESGSTCLVAVNQRRRGYRAQVRTLQVLDLWGCRPAQAIRAVSAQLAGLYAREVDMIISRGQPEDRQRQLIAAGFVRRALPRAIGDTRHTQQ